MTSSRFRMPAEWEPHDATWIAWPHEPTDWPEKLPTIEWVYAEIARVLSRSERVEILCTDQTVVARAEHCLAMHRVPSELIRLHVVPNDRSWLRDSAPTAVLDEAGTLHWIRWTFRAWAKYENYARDAGVGEAVRSISGWPAIQAERPDRPEPLSLEGGAIDTDGEGTLLTTEECLLSHIQERNPGLDRAGYEAAFARYLGITQTIWLGNGCAGDDTHGHVDDIARFVRPGVVVLAYEEDPADENHRASADNLQRLRLATDARGRALEVVTLPMPRPIWFGEERLPASYANFYIANGVVVVPTFNDKNDRKALETLTALFPGREVVGLHAVDLVLGQGTLHCLTQQQPSHRLTA